MIDFSTASGLIGIAMGLPIGSAFNQLATGSHLEGGVGLHGAIAEARASTDWHVWARVRSSLGTGHARSRTHGSSGSDGDWGRLLGSLGVTVYLVYLYAIFSTEVATVLAVAAGLTLLSTVATFAILFWQGVVAGRRFAWELLSVLLYVLFGVTSAIWLLHPLMHPVLQTFLERVDPADRTFSAAVSAVMHAQGSEVPVLLCQAVGAVIAFFVLVSGTSLCIASVAGVYVVLGGDGAWGRWLWRPVFWTVRWSTGMRWTLAFSALASILLTSGIGVEAGIRVATWVSDVIPSAGATVVY
ncbi:hypothetical protein ACIPJ2_15145 [Curtobacterium sp. NPDC090217]|uniref:hypothetical protein n=1 Tax=Curtobacterium sp. NPDC090217 TaxID=3363970 RepID=UPI0037FB20D1